MKSKILFLLFLIGLFGIGAYFGHRHGRSVWVPLVRNATGTTPRTVQSVVSDLTPDAGKRMQLRLANQGLSSPPAAVRLLAFKAERRLELWCPSADAPEIWRWVHSFPILGASGQAGPKLREGDRQVPEGFYRISALNPNSSYHLSMKINYPNGFDRKHAARENRTSPGGNIFIHGKDVSIGCLAIGDDAIEELFALVAGIGIEACEVWIYPTDPRTKPLVPPIGAPEWTYGLYIELTRALENMIPNTGETDFPASDCTMQAPAAGQPDRIQEACHDRQIAHLNSRRRH